MQGIGNDFIVIDDRNERLHLSTDEVIALCDRRFGIGADGVMLIRNPKNAQADFSWWFVNNDGSVPEMCGNGSRCFARYVFEKGLIDPETNTFVLETLCGLKTIKINTDKSRNFVSARVDMGQALSLPAAIPTTLGTNEDGYVLHQSLTTASGREVIVNGVNVGNPHAVLFADENPLILEDELFYLLGPELEKDIHFPAKTNVEFIQVDSPHHLTMRVWERGVGETFACGTGACASAFAAYLSGRTKNQVEVALKGGNLQIEINENHEVFMTGTAHTVYTGTFDATI